VRRSLRCTRVRDFLVDELLPHELEEERTVYPALRVVFDDEDPTVPLVRTHREIARRIRLFDRLVDDLADDGPDREEILDLQRSLFGLHAILEIHLALEEELYSHLAAQATDATRGIPAPFATERMFDTVRRPGDPARSRVGANSTTAQGGQRRGRGAATAGALAFDRRRATTARDSDRVVHPEFADMEFVHVRAKSLLNRVPDGGPLPFSWTINVYRGCSHACTYCFARPFPHLARTRRRS
jgi:hypothetical protein